MQKHGGTLPVRLTDSETGKVVHSDEDVLKLAKWSASRGGPAANWSHPKLDYASIKLKCTHCGDIRDRFFHQRNGFLCYNCNEQSLGIKLPEDEKLWEQIYSCGISSSEKEQANSLYNVLKEYIDKHNQG